MQDTSNKTIFVLLASFRDPECETTINELFFKAQYPDNIFIGVLWQYSPDDDFRCFDPNIKYKKNIRYKDVLYYESKGVCWARNIVQDMYNGEEYILIIDSHMLLEENWDTYFINELDATPSKKSIISCYPPAYDLPRKKANLPPLVNAAHSRLNRFEKDIPHPYNLRCNMFKFKKGISLDTPMRALFYAAGFAFAPAEFLKDVPYDSLLDWEEEEMAISLKLWTYGWDMYAPRKHYIYHLYHQNKIVPDFRKAVTKDALKARGILSKKRFKHLLGISITADVQVLKSINKYKLGNERSIQSFEMFGGVNFKTQSSSEQSINCWFSLESKSHPLYFQDNIKSNYIELDKKKTDKLNTQITKLKQDFKINSTTDLNFSSANLIEDSVAKVDLIILQDVLTYLTVHYIIKILSNVKNSGSKYLLTTQYLNVDRFRDLYQNGKWHTIDLVGPPFNFLKPLMMLEDETDKNKYLALWRIDELPEFAYERMQVNSLDSKNYTSINKFISHDESNFLATYKYLKHLNNNIKSYFVDKHDKSNNPIIKRIINNFGLFINATDKDFININIIELEPETNLILSYKNNSKVLISLLHCDVGQYSFYLDSEKNNFVLNQGDALLVSQEDINKITISSANDLEANTILMICTINTSFADIKPKKSILENLNSKNSDKTLRMTLSGDLILTRWMHKIYQNSSTKDILGEIYPLFHKSDLNMSNLETVISHRGSMHKKNERSPYYFRTNEKLANFLFEANIGMVTTGNNHAMDFGEVALLDQKDFLNTHNIVNAGSGENLDEAMEPAFISIKETTIALISFCTVRPKNLGATKTLAGVFQINDLASISKTLKPIIDKCKQHADIIIVSPHWIENWIFKPKEIIREQARELLDLGCHAIFGHSSHVLHSMEIYNNKPIIYDMGTFLIDNINGHKEMKYAAIFELLIEKKQIANIIIHPITGKNGHVDFSNNNDSKKIIKLLTSSGLNDLEKLQYTVEDNKIIVNLKVEDKKSNQLLAYKHKKYIQRDSSISNTINIKENFKPIELENGYSVKGINTVESCSLGAGFVFEVAFEVGEVDDVNYEVHVKAISTVYNVEFNEYHLVSDGIVDKLEWKKGKLIIDEHFFRFKKYIKSGIYDMYWGLYNPITKRYIQSKEKKDLVKVSTIYILPFGLNRYASGIEWNGKLPPKTKEQFEYEFMVSPELSLMKYIDNILFHDNNKETYSINAIEQKYSILNNGFRVYLNIENQNNKSIAWGSKRNNLKDAILRNIEKIQSHSLFKEVVMEGNCKITFEMSANEEEVEMSEFLLSQDNALGLSISINNEMYILLPSESKTKNIITNKEKFDYIIQKHSLKVDSLDIKLFLLSSIFITKQSDSITIEKLGFTS